MTLNEAIEYYDSLAEECRRKASIERNDYMDLRDESAEYSQLSEWLAELAVLREKVNCSELPNSSADCVYRQADLIDRAAAQTELQFAARRYTVAHEAHGEGRTVWSDNLISVTDAMNALRKMPSVQAEQKWIPCSERLPNHDEYIKNNGLFIVSDGNRSYSEWYDIYDKRRFGEPTMSGFRIDYAVTEWMPLPEPYRGDADDRSILSKR